MPHVSGLARLVARTLLGCLALLGLGTLWLCLQLPSLVSIAAMVGIMIFSVVPLVGAYVAERRPHNPVGWMFLAAGVSLGLFLFSGSYGYAALTLDQSRLPGGAVFGWLEGWSWAYSVPLVASFGILLFPDGQLPGRRWRPVAVLSGVMLALLTFGLAFSPDLFDWELPNPFALPWGLAGSALVVQNVGLASMFPVATLTAISMYGRFCRADARLRPVLLMASAVASLIAFSYLGCIVWSLNGQNTLPAFAAESVPVVRAGGHDRDWHRVVRPV